MRSLCAAPRGRVSNSTFFPSFLPSFLLSCRGRGSSASWKICREESGALEDFGDWWGGRNPLVSSFFRTVEREGEVCRACVVYIPESIEEGNRATGNTEGGGGGGGLFNDEPRFKRFVGENIETRCSRMLQFKIAVESSCSAPSSVKRKMRPREAVTTTTARHTPYPRSIKSPPTSYFPFQPTTAAFINAVTRESSTDSSLTNFLDHGRPSIRFDSIRRWISTTEHRESDLSKANREKFI